jgi:hypothetical protein
MTITENLALPAQTAPTETLAVLGVDPGARWTAGVLRAGQAALYGWTIGPRSETGVRDRTALDDPDDMAAVGRYVARVIEQIDATLDIAEARGFSRVRIGVEMIRVPVGWRHGRKSAVSLVDWLMPRQIGVAVMAAYPNARLVLPASHGMQDRESYPAELRRRRPPGWGVNETPKHERDHERAAYDVAGAAALQP